MKRKVAIVGTAPSSYELAPFDDPEWEIWGTSRLYHSIPRWDVWFELHPLSSIGKGWECPEPERKKKRAKHLKWLSEQSCPVYLQEEDERVPAGLKYPLEEVLDYLESVGAPERYLTNHPSYMIALAIYAQVDEIGIWGVDMAMTSEYDYQRPSCEYLIGLARGLGIKVHVPKEADLLKCIHLYGYEDDSPFHAKLRSRKRELEARKRQAKQEKRTLELQHASIHGRVGLIEDLCKNGIPEQLKEELIEHGEHLAQEAQKIEQQVGNAKSNIAAFRGALDDVEYWQRSWF